MSNHTTPGDWQASKLASPDYAPQYAIYAGDSRNALAVVTGPNAKGDADLIAAAPSMHAILSKLLAAPVGISTSAALIREARAVLATLPQ